MKSELFSLLYSQIEISSTFCTWNDWDGSQWGEGVLYSRALGLFLESKGNLDTREQLWAILVWRPRILS